MWKPDSHCACFQSEAYFKEEVKLFSEKIQSVEFAVKQAALLKLKFSKDEIDGWDVEDVNQTLRERFLKYLNKRRRVAGKFNFCFSTIQFLKPVFVNFQVSSIRMGVCDAVCVSASEPTTSTSPAPTRSARLVPQTMRPTPAPTTSRRVQLAWRGSAK